MKPAPTTQKLRGGYYTPQAIATFLADWAIRQAGDRLLEPSCGDGAILAAAATRLHTLSRTSSRVGQIVGIELELEESEKARALLRQSGLPPASRTIVQREFFEQCIDWAVGAPLFCTIEPFDAIVGNPPFVRYQSFPEEQRRHAFELMARAGLAPNRLTNAWVPFVVASCLLLNEAGRLAMVLPGELLQVSYSGELRRLLVSSFERLNIVTFRTLVFGDVQQEIVLLLAERSSRTPGMAVFELDGAADLEDLDVDCAPAHPIQLDHAQEKWTRYFLNRRQLTVLRRALASEGLHRLGDLAQVDVGLVTGDNSFFALSSDLAEQLELLPYTERLVTRSAQVRGLRFDEADWRERSRTSERVLLFCPPDTDKVSLPGPALRYVAHGERQKVHKGYKCGQRKRWYVVPSQWVPDAFALRQVHLAPRIVLNDAGAQVTDTLHRLKFKRNLPMKQIAAAFVNSLTLASSEVMGRSYGGGVLTFEPTEVEALPLPLRGANRLDFDELDRLLRANRIYECLEITDRVLLQETLGLSRRDVLLLRRSWEVLRDRRVRRRSSIAKEA